MTNLTDNVTSEQDFNARFAQLYGFDLNKGDSLVVGSKFDLSAIPEKYKDQVKISPHGEDVLIVQLNFGP